MPRHYRVFLTCSIDGCDKPHLALGLCSMHYYRLKRTGSTNDPRASLLERFYRSIVQSGDCWMWSRVKAQNRYGHFNGLPAHRWAYEYFVGPIPDGLEIDHLCRNRACVNPEHLEPVTHRENVLRGIAPQAGNARKTHCIHGHEFTPENIYVPPRGGTLRMCRACMKISKQRQRVKER